MKPGRFSFTPAADRAVHQIAVVRKPSRCSDHTASGRHPPTPLPMDPWYISFLVAPFALHVFLLALVGCEALEIHFIRAV